MKLMSIERFNEIKNRFREFYSLIQEVENETRTISEEEEERLEEEINKLIDELAHSDLSQIPAEEYEGLFDFGIEFEGTGANLDFRLIDTSYRSGLPVRLKGCNVIDFDFDKLPYDEDSFDEAFIEAHRDRFWGREEGREIPIDVRKRYYSKDLTLEDLVKYDLFDKVNSDRCDYFAEEVIRHLTPEVLKQIDLELFRTVGISGFDLGKLEEPIDTMEKYDDFLREQLEKKLTMYSIPEEFYYRIKDNPTVRELVPEYIVDIPEDNEALRNAYLRDGLHIWQVYDNRELFRGKKFVGRMYEYQYGLTAEESGVTEEKYFYLFDNYPEFTEDLITNAPQHFTRLVKVIDPEKTLEENTAALKEGVRSIASNQYASESDKIAVRRLYGIADMIQDSSEYTRDLYEEIIRYTTQEVIEESGIPATIFLSTDVLNAFRTFGFERMMQFDRENGNIFTKDPEYRVLKGLFERFIHYGGNDHNPQTTIYTKEIKEGEDYQRPFTEEEFEESIIRMMRKDHSDDIFFDQREFSDGFRERHPRLYLPKDAPEELQEKFYTKSLTISDIDAHRDWVPFLSDIDLSVGFGDRTGIFVNDSYDFYLYMGLFGSGTKGVEFLLENKKYIDFCNSLTGNYSHQSVNVHVESIDDLDRAYKDGLKELVFGRGGFRFDYDALPITEEQKMLYVDTLITYDPEYLSSIGLRPDISKITEFTEQGFRKEIEDRIIAGMYNGIIKYSPEKYPEFAKERNPDLFLADDAPLELQKKFYTADILGENTSYYKITIADLVNPEYRDFLVGKNIAKKSPELSRALSVFSREELIEIADIDLGAIELYANNPNNMSRLKNALNLYPDKFAREEIMGAYDLSEEEFLEKMQNDPAIIEEYDKAKDRYRKDVITMPGLILYGPEEISRADFRNYRALLDENDLKNASDFRRDVYEQIIAHMYGFLGFEEAKKLLEPPELSPENLDALYQLDERIKNLYEKKFELTGNIKTLTVLLNGVPGLLPGTEKVSSKNTLNIFKSINMKINSGYEGDIRGLLTECLSENGMPANSSGIDELASKVISLGTEMKLDDLREFTSMQVEGNIQENAKTRKKIKEIYRDALKYSLSTSEKVDPALVREYLEKEFARTKDNGEAYYSPHVTSHLEDLVGFAQGINEDPDQSLIANKTIVDSLKQESQKIGKGWIRRIIPAIQYPVQMTYEQAIELDQTVYGENSTHEVETRETVGLKELSEEERKEVLEVLRQSNFGKFLSFNKAEIMFSGLRPPFSEGFKKFFLEHKEEFLENPEFYSAFTKMHGKFDGLLQDPTISRRYGEGLFTVQNLLDLANANIYNNVEKGEYELAYQAKKAGLTQEQFDIAKRLYKEMKQREASTVPPEKFETPKYRGRIVRIDDPLHLCIGEITNCCQTIGEYDPGESSMIHSATEHNGALFVVEELDENGNSVGIVAQSWTWRNGNRVTFDNVEIPTQVRQDMSRLGGFDGIMEAYEGAARRMIETDRKALEKLLKEGKITEEEYKKLVIKDVTMGKGCDDLIGNLSKEVRGRYPSATSVSPLEIGKTYTGSKERGLYTDAKSVILIAHNDEFDENDHIIEQGEVIDRGVRYTKTREIFRRKGEDIDPDKIEAIAEMNARNGMGEDDFFYGATHIQDLIDKLSRYGFEKPRDNYSISMSDNADWYMFMEESESGVMIVDSGIDLSKEPTTDREKMDRKMSIAEYTREVLMLAERTTLDGKKFIIDPEREGKILPLDSLKESGEIEVKQNGEVVVLDRQKLRQRIENMNTILENDRRERIISDIGEEIPGTGSGSEETKEETDNEGR